MKSERITFENAEGIALSGRIDFPVAGSPKAYVLFAHCFTCGKNLLSVDNISRAMTQEGMAVLRFDFTGLGQSSGDFADSNFSSNLRDLEAAYDFMSTHYQAPQIMMGHSLGGAAVLHISGKLEAVKAVITVGAPSTPAHVRHILKDGEEALQKEGVAEVNIGGRPFKMKKQFLDDLEQNDSQDPIGSLGKPLLIMHSPIDSIVGIDNATEIYLSAKHPKSFISLDDADHLLLKEADSRYVGQVSSSWASKYIIDQSDNKVAPEGEVWARMEGDSFTTEIMAGDHKMLADEPASVGGKDLGPSPYGYLLSALGACTTMTLKMYADHKKIDLESVEIQLTHDKIHVRDGENSERPGAKIDQIKRKIKVTGNMTDEQKARMIEIADRCPVHKTLEGKPLIITEGYE